jgi:hypothetical protein
MGAIVVHYFLTWVTTKKENGGGGGGGNWVDKHIKTFVNIAGAQLGVAKAASALMSGEMSDTVILGALGSVVEKFIPRRARYVMMCMLIKAFICGCQMKHLKVLIFLTGFDVLPPYYSIYLFRRDLWGSWGSLWSVCSYYIDGFVNSYSAATDLCISDLLLGCFSPFYAL